MHAEISKRAFGEVTERKHYDSVNMQMGRVQLDSDWNEAFETLLNARSRSLADIIGDHGTPNDGFRVEDNLILDHLDSLKGWTFTGGGSCRVNYLEKKEGLGSFMISGSGELKRQIPSLLTNMENLRKILEDRGAVVVSTPRLLLYYKVAATEDANIQIEISKTGGLDPVATDSTLTYPCDAWQVIELDLATIDLDEYKTISISVDTIGTVYLDCLAIAPGLEADDSDRDFYIQGGDGSNDKAGRYYADGLVAVKEGFETYSTQKDYPEPPDIDLDEGGDYLAYLDLWKRTVTHVEDPDILEVALDGPDTCTREQMIAQVKVIAASKCEENIPDLLRPDGTGTLSTGLSPHAEQGECDFKPELDYTGLENSLYRIEIHEGGDSGSATFKWSRNNGADLVAIIGFDADTKSVIVPSDRFLCHGDWVELSDDVSDLADFTDSNKHGVLAKIIDMDHQTDGVKILLENNIGDFTTSLFKNRTDKHPKLRKWHGVENVSDYLAFDTGGLPEEELEHGILIAFSEGQFYHGDYWQFTARVNTRAIEELDHEPPMGPVHHYAPLGAVSASEENIVFNSCRKVFPPLTDITAGNVSFDPAYCESLAGLGITNVQQALEYLCGHNCCNIIVLPGQSIQDAINGLGPDGGTIYLAPGIHIVHETIIIGEKKDILIKGDGPVTRVIYLPKPPEADEELMKKIEEEISAKEEEIKAAMEAGNDELAHGLRADRRGLQVEYYRAMGLRDKEIEVREKINEVQDLIDEAGDNPEELDKLWQKYEELKIILAGVLYDQLLDLFRVTSSVNIGFERFLMFAFGADSLTAIVEGSKGTRLQDCDLINLPERKDEFYRELITDEPGRLDYVRSNIAGKEKSKSNKSIYPCVRINNGCRIELKDNRIAGTFGLIQEGGYDAKEMPVLDELICVGNRIRTSDAGLIFIKCIRSLIEENTIYDVELGLSEEDLKLLEELIDEEIDPDDPCKVRLHGQINELIDTLRDMLFGCTPGIEDGVRMQSAGITAYVIKKSGIINNRIMGNSGMHLFYSKDNNILGNNVVVSRNALTVTYNFRTSVRNNHLEMAKATYLYDSGILESGTDELKEDPVSHDMPEMEAAAPAPPSGVTIAHEEPEPVPVSAEEEEAAPIAAHPAVEAAVPEEDTVTDVNELTNDSSSITRRIIYGKTEGLSQVIGKLKYGVIEVHFSDRFKFTDNRIKGPNGWLSGDYDVEEYVSLLKTYAEVWNTPFKEEASVVLVREFIDLMGLSPTFNLLETLLSIFTGGREVDWVAFMVEAWIGKPIGSKNNSLRESIGFMDVSAAFKENPFITLLIKLFNYLLNMQVVSRTDISGNRFDIEGVGIEMPDGITLGGVKISANRIAGQGDGGIIWRALPLLNNPDLLGLLLGCAYSMLLYVLAWIRKVLQQLIEILEGGADGNEGGEGVSAIMVLVTVFTLYGIGQVCPDDNGGAAGETGEGESAPEPENPFLIYLKELVAALDELIEQLDDEDVARSIDDLAGSDNRLIANKIQGIGTGIRTNVANSRIESNNIDLGPGKSAVEELFAMGRLLTAHAKVIQCLDDIFGGSGDVIDHTAIVSLGNAIMGMNPDSMEVSREMLEKDPGQWLELDDVLETIREIAISSPLTERIANRLDQLNKALIANDMEEVKTASGNLIDEFKRHLTGYGMILEAPGMQVIKNRIEGQTACENKEDFRRSPGGILMTCGNDLRDMVAYFLLMEEILPLVNMGGQGTLFSGNSIQWGTGHGLMLSGLPIISDIKIEDNEIQNHGLSGIYCDAPGLASLLTGNFSPKLFAGSKIGISILYPILFGLLSSIFMVYKLRITGNEVNQCFGNKAEGFYSETPPASPPKNLSDNVRMWGLFPTILGGLVIKNASEVNCSYNNIRYCGKDSETWNCFGSVFYQSNDVKYENNKLLGNGRAGSENTLYYPRGGALFNGIFGSLAISNNDFIQNEGNTLVVVPDFSIIGKIRIHIDPYYETTIIAPLHTSSWSLDRLLILGNEFDIQDTMGSIWSKIHAGLSVDLGDEDYSYDTIKDLTFSQNQTSLPGSVSGDQWGGIYLAGERLTFNGNMVRGGQNVVIHLLSDKGMGMGNILNDPPMTSGDVLIAETNNRW